MARGFTQRSQDARSTKLMANVAKTRAQNKAREQAAKRKRKAAQAEEDAARAVLDKAKAEKVDVLQRSAFAKKAHGDANKQVEEADKAVFAARKALEAAERFLEKMRGELVSARGKRSVMKDTLDEVLGESKWVLKRHATCEAKHERAAAARQKADREVNSVMNDIRAFEGGLREIEVQKMKSRMHEMQDDETCEQMRREQTKWERNDYERRRASRADDEYSAYAKNLSPEELEAARIWREYKDAVRREQVRCINRDKEYSSSSTDATKASIKRFTAVSTEFDDIQFNATQPLTFESVPWPILCLPAEISLDDINWDAVEKFFAAVKSRVAAAEYKTIVDKAHKRFHPDKWRARGLLKTVLDDDDELRERLEEAGNTVAQAITPIWKASRA